MIRDPSTAQFRVRVVFCCRLCAREKGTLTRKPPSAGAVGDILPPHRRLRLPPLIAMAGRRCHKGGPADSSFGLAAIL